MTRPVLIGTALAAALLLTWLAWDGWFYIQRGYSLRVGLAGEPGSIFHIDFPTWRAVAHVFLWVTAVAAIAAYAAGARWASITAWLTFVATLLIGICDIAHYGTMGSPTSIWTILLLLLFAMLTRFRPPAQSEDA